MRQDELIGRTVAGRFRVTRRLGEGGMAVVYAAEQAAEPRQVALKIMNRELTADRSFVHRFQREAKAASLVGHPNSVQILDYGVAGDLSYIAMELLVGEDLYALLEKGGPVAQSRAARILAEVCDALAVAHEMGIVHRDLKPENIMVIPDPDHADGERVKVLDFGIAKLLDAEDQPGASRVEAPSAVTRAGTFIGTPAYMSPEQCGLLPLDTRSDLYTCGVLLFQLVTGKVPFQGETPLHTATLHIHQPPPAPSSLAPNIDPRLERLILLALQKKPGDRPQSAASLAAALRNLYPDLPEVPATLPDPSRRGARIAHGDEQIGQATTMVADGVGPPPAVVLHRTPPPPATSIPPSSDPATLIRSPESMRRLLPGVARMPDEPPAPPSRVGPRNTEVIEVPPEVVASAPAPIAPAGATTTLSSAAQAAPKVVIVPPPAPAPPAPTPAAAPPASSLAGARGVLVGFALGLVLLLAAALIALAAR